MASIFDTLHKHFSLYKSPVDSHGNTSYMTTALHYRVKNFNISAYTVPVTGKKNYLQYHLVISKVNTQNKVQLNEKDFFKILKQKSKDKYLFYIVSFDKEPPVDALKNPAYLFMEDALKNTNKKAKTLWGLKESGKFSCVAKVTKGKEGEGRWKARSSKRE